MPDSVDYPIITTLRLCSGAGMLETAVSLGCEYFGWRVDRKAGSDKISGHGRYQRPVPKHQQPVKEVANV